MAALAEGIDVLTSSEARREPYERRGGVMDGTQSAPEAPLRDETNLAPPEPTLKDGASWRTGLERRLLSSLVGSIDGIELRESPGEPLEVHGPLRLEVRDPALPIRLTVRDRRAWSAAARHGSAGLGEGYFRAWWDTDDLVGLLRLFVRRSAGLDEIRSQLHRLGAPVTDRIRQLRPANRQRDRNNVRAHYDLSNRFFTTFLDETMTYSCAVFESPTTPLAEASIAKLDRICKKLDLSAGHRLVEIGSGWGSFAIHAASRYEAEVTTTTISTAQAELARKRIAEHGLTERIELVELDYRELEGKFDRLASIEMVEAVDWRELPTFFSSCARLLCDDGLMGLQAIVCADQRHDRVKVTDDFITTWVFPGGCLPSITSIANATTRASDLRIIDLEDLGAHYAETLGRWRTTLHRSWDELAAQGLSLEMARLWDFYLAYCQAAFLERHVTVVQLVLAKPAWRPDGLELRSL
jgi:cyclopropane-fatty-acyl-phospholipid synthase